jgi:hypothetical protein
MLYNQPVDRNSKTGNDQKLKHGTKLDNREQQEEPVLVNIRGPSCWCCSPYYHTKQMAHKKYKCCPQQRQLRERICQSSRTISSVVLPAEEAAPPAFSIEAELPPANMMMPRSTIERDGKQTFMI